jgi:hypothetical protein
MKNEYATQDVEMVMMIRMKEYMGCNFIYQLMESHIDGLRVSWLMFFILKIIKKIELEKNINSIVENKIKIGINHLNTEQ